jgi:(R,R)-butanediol dehydrogenase/meso-butanediol dehydrogenase/diacetyl reductase
MRSIIVDANQTATLVERADPEPGDDEVIIRVVANGLCGSDIAALQPGSSVSVEPGTTLGHEIAGVVVGAGRGAKGFLGARVAVHPNIACGQCSVCRSGRPNLCPTQRTIGIHRDGGVADYVAAPRTQLYEVPPDLDLELAALTEPLACVLNGIEKARLKTEDSAVILGGGPIGLLFTSVLATMDVHPILVSEPIPYRVELARRMGATHVINPRTENLGDAAEDLMAGKGATVVVDAVGGLLGEAATVVAPGGLILEFGAHARLCQVDALDVVLREIRIQGVYTALFTFERAIAFLSAHAKSLSPLISHRFALEDFGRAVSVMREGVSGKVLIVPAITSAPDSVVA